MNLPKYQNKYGEGYTEVNMITIMEGYTDGSGYHAYKDIEFQLCRFCLTNFVILLMARITQVMNLGDLVWMLA